MLSLWELFELVRGLVLALILVALMVVVYGCLYDPIGFMMTAGELVGIVDDQTARDFWRRRQEYYERRYTDPADWIEAGEDPELRGP